MIINEMAGSGGDLMPYMFKRRKLGPLVGKRTWGGLVHTADSPPFVDGGSMIAPRGGFFTRDGRWAVENEGVAPDIDVENWPKDVIAGRDPQLERAVAEAMRLLKERPVDRMTKNRRHQFGARDPSSPLRYFASPLRTLRFMILTQRTPSSRKEPQRRGRHQAKQHQYPACKSLTLQ